METILFQGDSITDARRDRTDGAYNGMGYATMTAGILGYNYPGHYSFVNRGIGGNRVVDLYARWKVDCINIKPDILSILIGVNDVWHELEFNNGVSERQFRTVYSMLIEEALEAMPNLKIMLLEPFLMRYTATEDKWEQFSYEVKKRAEITKELSEKFNLGFVPLQHAFNEAMSRASAECWTVDGVHPAAAGHQLIALEWLKCFEKNIK